MASSYFTIHLCAQKQKSSLKKLKTIETDSFCVSLNTSETVMNPPSLPSRAKAFQNVQWMPAFRKIAAYLLHSAFNPEMSAVREMAKHYL